MLLFATGMMVVFSCATFLHVEQARVTFFALSHCLPDVWKVHQWPTQSPLQKSRAPVFLLPSPTPEAWDPAGISKTHSILTSNWKKYWEVLGFLGSSWKQRDGRCISCLWIVCENTASLQDNFSKIESIYRPSSWGSAPRAFSRPMDRLCNQCPGWQCGCAEFHNLFGVTVGLIYQGKIQPFPEAAEL